MSGDEESRPATLPPFMPPPFLDPAITDEQHTPSPYPPFTNPGSVPVFDPSLAPPIPNSQSQARNQHNIQRDRETESNSSGDAGGGIAGELGNADVGNGFQNVKHRSTSGSILTMPTRRALRACSNCRKDKTKCDGSRPCGGCMKKGFKADECVDGCVQCRKERIRCLGGNPCVSCAEKNIPCVEDPDNERRSGPPLNRSINVLDFSGPQAMGSGVNGVPHGLTMIQNEHGQLVQVPFFLDHTANSIQVNTQHPPRQRTNPSDRAKQACVSCRRDNKKCSNSRPCARCLARNEECQEFNRALTSKRLKLRCKSCRRDNKKCEEARPCNHCVSIGEQCEDMPRKGRGSGSRVKVACMSCRKDKIQCEAERPCKGCVRKGIECVERVCGMCGGDNPDCTHCRHRRRRGIPDGEEDEEMRGFNGYEQPPEDNGRDMHGERLVAGMQYAHPHVQHIGELPHPHQLQLMVQQLPLLPKLNEEQQMYFAPSASEPSSPRRNVSSMRFGAEQESS